MDAEKSVPARTRQPNDEAALARRVGENLESKAPYILRSMAVVDTLYKSMLAIGAPLVGPVRGTLFRVVQETPHERFRLLFDPGPECYGNPGRKFYEHCMSIDQEPVLAIPLSACRVADSGETVYACVTRYGVSLAYLPKDGAGGDGNGKAPDGASRTVSLPSDQTALGVHMEMKDFTKALSDGALVPLGLDGAEDPESIHAAWDVFTNHTFFYEPGRTATPASLMEDGQYALFRWPDMDLPLFSVACSTFFIDTLYEASRQGFNTLERPLDVFLWRLANELFLCREYRNKQMESAREKLTNGEINKICRKRIQTRVFEDLYLPFLHADDQRHCHNVKSKEGYGCNIALRRFLSFLMERPVVDNIAYGMTFFDRWAQVPWDPKKMESPQPTGMKTLDYGVEEKSFATRGNIERLTLNDWTQDCLRQMHAFYESQALRIPRSIRTTLAVVPTGVQHNIFNRPRDIGRDAEAVENRPIADYRFVNDMMSRSGTPIQSMRQYCFWGDGEESNTLYTAEQSPLIGMRLSAFSKRPTRDVARDLLAACYVPGLLSIPAIPVDGRGEPRPQSMESILRRDDRYRLEEEARRRYRRTGDGPCASAGFPKHVDKLTQFRSESRFGSELYRGEGYKMIVDDSVECAVNFYANLYPTFMTPKKEDLERERQEAEAEARTR